MTEQALDARRAYKREWAKRNPDKVKEQQRRYWERVADKKQGGQQEQTAAGAAPGSDK